MDRRVEITGPVERKMIINALNSGANVFMADFEDSNSPTWRNNMEGQINLRHAVNRTIGYVSPDGKRYQLHPHVATLMVRPRGWHMVEKHFLIDDEPVSASLFDFGLFFFSNARRLVDMGSRPYFYLPKLQSRLEARLWNDVFLFAQDYIGLHRGTIRATVLIETIHAAFEMDEILYELREHSAGLNCGRWDYIFSFVKAFRNEPDFVLPDRDQVTMDRYFLKSYAQLLIETCHKRGVHAIGGMAPQIPVKNDRAANDRAFEKVRQDKLREVRAGHDGTWVAHPALVHVAKDIFDAIMGSPHQIHQRIDTTITADDLLSVPVGSISEAGLRRNIDVGIRYLESWLRGEGCVVIYDRMEDTATAEICRTQVWQWLKYRCIMDDARRVTPELVHRLTAETVGALRNHLPARTLDLAAAIFHKFMTASELPDFLTTSAYDYLDAEIRRAAQSAS
jgi:malate synthase